MVPGKRLVPFLLLLCLNQCLFARGIDGSFVVSSISYLDNPLIYDFNKNGNVRLHFINGKVIETRYKIRKSSINIDFESKSVQLIMDTRNKSNNIFEYTDDRKVRLLQIDSISYLGREILEQGNFFGVWESNSCNLTSPSSKSIFEFMKNNKFVFSQDDLDSKISNVYSWRLYKVNSMVILVTRFINSRLFFIKNFDDDHFNTTTLLNDKLCNTLFVRLEEEENKILALIQGKWTRVEESNRLPVELDIGNKIGIKFENEVDFSYYDWEFAVTGNIIVLESGDQKPLYPNNFSIELGSDKSLQFDHGGFKAKFRRIH